MITFKCIKCDSFKALTEFSKDSSYKSGYKNQCKQCRNKYMSDYNKGYVKSNKKSIKQLSNHQIKRDRNRAAIDRFKMDCGCKDCGEHYRGEPWLLEFDHREPKYKDAGISKLMHRDLDIIKLEIAKCDVVCLICHKRRTAKRGGWSIAHLIQNPTIDINSKF